MGQCLSMLVASLSVHHFEPDWNIFVTTAWITMDLGTGIRGSQRMNPFDFSDPLTFPLAPPANHIFHLFGEPWMDYHKIVNIFLLRHHEILTTVACIAVTYMKHYYLEDDCNNFSSGIMSKSWFVQNFCFGVGDVAVLDCDPSWKPSASSFSGESLTFLSVFSHVLLLLLPNWDNLIY